jgi:hypothetical protein
LRTTIRHYVAALAAVPALLLTAGLFGTAAPAEAAVRPAAAAVFVCANAPIPPGYVITESLSSLTCGGGVEYQLTQVTTQASLFVCDNSPIPPNWVITYVGPSASCVTDKVYEITGITTQTSQWVCANSPIPAGWTIESTGPTTDCGGLSTYHLVKAA